MPLSCSQLHSCYSSCPNPIKPLSALASLFQEPKTWLLVPFRTHRHHRPTTLRKPPPSWAPFTQDALADLRVNSFDIAPCVNTPIHNSPPPPGVFGQPNVLPSLYNMWPEGLRLDSHSFETTSPPSSIHTCQIVLFTEIVHKILSFLNLELFPHIYETNFFVNSQVFAQMRFCLRQNLAQL